MALQSEEKTHFIIENQGERIFGVLHRPVNVSNMPIVIIAHGFASHKVGTNRSYVTLAASFAKKGLATCRFDFRGCGDSDGTTQEMTPSGYVSDLIAVYKFIISQGFEKVGFFGSSFGGTVAVLAAKHCPQLAALALWAPVASGALWYNDWRERTNNALVPTVYKGAIISEKFKAEFADIAADQALANLKSLPLLHLQGEKDEVVTLSHAASFKRYREGAGGPTCFITYPDVTHTLGTASNLPEIVEATTNWFNKTL